MTTIAKRLLNVVLATAVTVQPFAPAEAAFYYRHQGGTNLDGDAKPIPPDQETAGYGALTLFAPLQVRGRPNIAFNLGVRAPGAKGAVAWSSVGKPLPSGLSLNAATGVISGAPQATGTYEGIQIAGQDGAGTQGTTRPFTISVPAFPTVTLLSAYAFPAGDAAAIEPKATDLYGSSTWSLSGPLPGGMRLDTQTGRISGTPERRTTGTNLILTVKDADGASGSSIPFRIDVTSSFTASGYDATSRTRAGAPFQSAQPGVSGTSNSVTWTLAPTSAPLPAGLSVDAYTGVIGGTPTVPGTYAGIVVRAEDNATKARAAADPLSIVVAPPTPTAAYAPATKMRVGDASGLTPTVSGLFAAGYWSLDGVLPVGLSLNSATGAVTGSPTYAGSGGAVARVLDLVDGRQGVSEAFEIAVAPALVLSGLRVPSARVEQPFAMSPPRVDGLQNGLSWSLVGTLPSGLYFDETSGSISGTPNEAGTTRLSYLATDAWDGRKASSGGFDLVVGAKGVPASFSVLDLASRYSGSVGSPIAIAPQAVGASGPVVWSVGGPLPYWASVNPATGRISGTPDGSGLASGLTLIATDTSTNLKAVSSSFEIAVTATQPLSLDAYSASGIVGQAFSSPAPAVANAAGTVRFARVAGTLPEGTSLDATTGIVTGQPTTVGDYAGIVITATDALGAAAASNPVTFSVRAPDAGVNRAASAYAPSSTTGTLNRRLSVVPGTNGLTAPVTWSLATGDKPSWATLDAATGILSGTPPASGTWAGLALKAVDSKGFAARTNLFSISAVEATPLSASMSGNLSAYRGVPYAATPSASGVQGSPAWRVETGILPAGLSLDPDTGRISGTPTTLGTSPNVSLSVVDGTGARATTNAASIVVGPAPLSASAPSILSGTQGSTFSTAASVTGASGAVTWTLATGTLPNGIGLTAANGLIAGTPTVAGTYGGISLKVVDAAGAQGLTGTFTVTVSPPAPGMSVSFPSVVRASYGAPLSASASVGGSTGSRVYELASGTLPTWARLNAATGALTGTPDSLTGASGLVVRLTDGTGTVASTQPFSIAVDRPTLVATGPSGPVSGRATIPLSSPAPSSTNAIGAVTWSLSNEAALPAGIRFDPATGVISGTSATPGTFSDMTLLATDGLGGTSRTQPFQLSISGAPQAFASSYAGRLSQPFTAQPSGSGLIGSQSWSLASGSLPGWARLNAGSGAISGTPDALGTTSGLSLRVVDATGASATTQAFGISVSTDLSATMPYPSYTGRVGVGFGTGRPQVVGGSAPFRWTLASGQMPDGLALDPELGWVVGTPTAPANATLALKVTDKDNSSVTLAPFGLQVFQAPTASMADAAGRVGAPFSRSPSASNARGNQVWTLAAGRLPSWANLNSGSGAITGTPDAVGTASGIALRLTDSDGATAVTQPFSVAVTPGIAVSGLDASYTNRAGQVFPARTPTVSGNLDPVTWSATGLPPGLAVSSSTGAISGSPATLGGWNATVSATDPRDRATASVPVAFTITEGLGITGTPGFTTHVGVATSSPALGLTGQRGSSVRWALVAGTLPTWATLTEATGIISGTAPAVATVSGLVLEATDLGDNSVIRTAPFSLQVLAEVDVIDVPTKYLGRVGFPFSSSPPTARNAAGATTWTWAAGVAPPAWARLNAATGVISGTPDAVGSTKGLILNVADQRNGSARSVAFELQTESNPAITLSAAGASVRLGEAVNLTATATGLVGTGTWSVGVNSGAVPAGLSVNPATGVFSGTPTATGNAKIVLRVTDSADGRVVDSAEITLVVNPSITLTLGSATVSGRQYANIPAGPDHAVTGNVGTVTYQMSVPVPAGMKLTKGVLSGVPTVAVPTQTVTLYATDTSDGRVAKANFVLSIPGQLAVNDVASVSVRNGADALATSFVPSVANASLGGTVTWDRLSGTLPNGVTVDPATGRLTGKPTGYAATQTFSPIVIRARDSDGSVAQGASFAVTVNPGLSVSAPAAQAARVGTKVVASMPAATNVTGVLTWAVTAGSLPNGIELKPDGTLTGTPTLPGSYSATATATDGGNATASVTLAYTVRDALVVTVPQTSITANVGDTPVLQAAQSGLSGAASWSLVTRSGTLPAGLGVNPSGTFTGKITATGLATVAIRLTDTADNATADSPSVSVDASPSFSIANIGTQYGRSNKDFSMPAPVVGKPPGALTWSFSGSPPPWAVLDTATGAISGRPTNTNAYTFALKATAAGQSVTSNSFQVNIASPLVAPTFPNLTFPVGFAVSATNPVTNTPSVSGARGTLTWTSNPAITPYKVSTNGANFGYITGTATAPFALNGVTFTATDVDGETVTTNAFTVAAVTVNGIGSQKGRVGVQAKWPAPVAIGFPGPVTWSLDSSSGTLPTGLSIDPSTGAVTGTASSGGTPTVVVRATSSNVSMTTSHILDVRNAFAPDGSILPDLTVNVGQTLGANRQWVKNFVNPVYFAANQDITPLGISTSGAASTNIYGTGPSTPLTLSNVVLTATDNWDYSTAVSNPFNVYMVKVTPPPAQRLRIGTYVEIPAPSATGFPGPVTWSAGNLPSGMKVNQATGVVSGTPTDYLTGSTVTLRATSGTATTTTTFDVNSSYGLTIGTQVDLTFRTNTGDTFNTVAANGRRQNLSWTLSQATGSVYVGAYQSNYGQFNAGYASTPVTYTGVTLKATDDYDGVTATTAPFNIYVVRMTPPPTQKLRAGTYVEIPAPSAVGFPGPVTWSAGNLPSGMRIDPATGVISGTPTDYLTNSTVTLRATSGTATTTTNFDINSSYGLSIGTQNDLTFRTNTGDTFNTVAANGRRQNLSWTLSQATGSVYVGAYQSNYGQFNAGYASNPVTYTGVTLKVTDDYDGVTATTAPFNIYVVRMTPPPTQKLRAGTYVEIPAPSAVGFPGPVTWSAGNLPSGMKIDQNSGIISGTPTDYLTGSTVTLRATSGTATATTTFDVNSSYGLSIGTQVDLTFRTNTGDTFNTVAANGRRQNLSWALSQATGSVYVGAYQSNYGQFNAGYGQTPGTYAGVTLKVTDDYDGVSATTPPFNVYVVRMTPPPTQKLRAGTYVEIPAPSAVGFPGPVTWTATGLPSGMQVNQATGVVSGTPDSATTYSPILRATSGTAAATTTFDVSVSSTLSIGTQADLTFRTGTNDAFNTVTALGRRQNLSWSLSQATSPLGVYAYIANNGQFLAGYASNPATYTGVTLKVTDDYDGVTATTAPFNIYVVQMTPPPTQKLRVGTMVSLPAPSAQGFPGAVTWTASNIPGGMQIDAATGVISGIPNSATSYTTILRATSGTATTTVSFDVAVSATLGIQAQSDLTFRTGTNDAFTTALALGRRQNLSWSLSQATSPLGVYAYIANNGQFQAGYASKPATYAGIALTVSDDYDGVTATSAPFNIYVVQMTPPPTQKLRVGTYAEIPAPSAQGFPGTVTWSATGLPSGMQVDATSGVVSGTPSSATSYTTILRATSGTATTTVSFDVSVSSQLALGTQPDLVFRTGTNDTFTSVTATGRRQNLSWSLSQATSPLGVYAYTINNGQFQAGYASNPATYAGVTLKVTDDYDGVSATSTPFNIYLVSIAGPASPPQGTRGVTYATGAASVNGLPGTVTWTLASGSLPTGLGVDGPTGAIVGTTSTAGTYNVTLRATSGTLTTTTPSVTSVVIK